MGNQEKGEVTALGMEEDHLVSVEGAYTLGT